MEGRREGSRDAIPRPSRGLTGDVMSVLAIDIGNSRVGLNVFTQGKAQDEAVRLAHAALDTDLASTLKGLWEKAQQETRDNGDDDTEVVITSVVPALTERIEYSA